METTERVDVSAEGEGARELEGKRILWHAAKKVKVLEDEAKCLYALVIDMRKRPDGKIDSEVQVLSYPDFIVEMMTRGVVAASVPMPEANEIPVYRKNHESGKVDGFMLRRAEFFGALDEPCP